MYYKCLVFNLTHSVFDYRFLGVQLPLDLRVATYTVIGENAQKETLRDLQVASGLSKCLLCSQF